MSTYQLNKALYALASRHQTAEALPDEALAAYELSPDERGALTMGDTDALYRLGANVADGDVGHAERRLHVDAHHVADLVHVDLVHRPRRHHRRVVEHDVAAPEGAQRVLEEPLGRLRVRDVSRDPLRLTQLLRQLAQRLLPPAADEELHARRPQVPRHRHAHPAAGARDERDLILQPRLCGARH